MIKQRVIKQVTLIGILTIGLNACFKDVRFYPPYNNFQISSRYNAFTRGASYKAGIIASLQRQDIQYVQYGDTMTLIVPTDHYYVFDTPRLNDICYPGLVNIIRLLKLYPQSTIYVAGFTDNVGSPEHKQKLSQARAETMLTFLWANGIAAHRLHAEGYGDKHDISQNKIIHGSAQNRRVEIQWFNAPQGDTEPAAYVK